MKKILMIGIAGSNNDFLLSLPSIKAYLMQFEEIKKDYEITIKNYFLDCNIYDIVRYAVEFKPDMICFSCYIWNMDKIKIISSLIRHELGNIKIIWGGPEISQEDIDNGEYVGLPVNELIAGEGEEKLYEILIGKKPREQKFEDMPSAYLIDCVPEELFENPDLRINIETQRGCNYKCDYCLYHKHFKKIKYRNPDIVIREIEYCFDKGVKIGKIVDANFFSDKEFTKKIIKGLIEMKIKMRLNFDMLPNFLDEELAELCEEYISISDENSLLAGIGLQSLNKESMKAINRIINLNSLDKSVNLLSEANATVRLDLILGLPYETKESYLKSLDYVIGKMRLGNHFLGLYLLKLLPGTKLNEVGTEVLKRDKEHNVYSTSTMPRKDMIECLRLNSIVHRIFNSKEIDKKEKLADIFFSLEGTNIEKIYKIYPLFTEYLKKKKSRFVEPDFPDAENYYLKEIFNDILDKDMIEIMRRAM